ncbi:CDP-diacylglycerol--glycerol-3-phosphate 3-phosphatidyltransferase [Protaetiibacter mangrovi]|uniref:CDP-diacylglycerol--glycerol-3-phosphate 3-phosphatidyltransferase n=1 Tax=Protaetiibacter mangrovi TaxID=2970926 RepID=A0ABT1ZF85_9MICO|nr:CDP-diacylglycerol--glycerol-3-phosphate 3-phosphatidyltransferase [Protaetiibacter mangrovi]MCS0499315.1 CDP-diacylglycerol--glycerol-3-phosphate 3-phosphatidyltransferase [Protaetiibacter mangrovi]TPX02978.1 CDP-diacylglycerol--glycerol-3-phosphate 3-phosphatidyltransferase [Schumannella luteola]
MRGRVVSPGETPASMGNIANIITVVRILLAPVFVWLMVLDGGELGVWRWVAGFLFILSITTDSVDGFLARRNNLVTDFGKLVDPIADKILVGAALVALSIVGELWWWVTIVILVREFGITIFRFLMLRDHVIPAGFLGKLKTVVQSVAVSFALVPLWTVLGDWVLWVNWVLMGAALVLTVVSGVQYLWDAWRVTRAARKAG